MKVNKTVLLLELIVFRIALICDCMTWKGRTGHTKINGNVRDRLMFVNIPNNISHTCGLREDEHQRLAKDFNRYKRLRMVEDDTENIEDDIDRILYGIENPQDLRGPYITKDGKIMNKKKSLYSTGELCHVDDFFEGKFKVEWTVRGVKEKLQYRYRDTHTLPLTTSRFTLGGVKGFVLRLWLDGHHGSKKGHIAMSLLQKEHWSSLESPICLFAGKIVKGPFFYRSPQYNTVSKSFCPLEDVIEDNTIKLGVMIAKRDDTDHCNSKTNL